MGKRRTRGLGGFVLFDIIYQDGTKSSHRRIPASHVEGLDGDKGATAFFEEQDRKTAQMSGVQRGPVKSIIRSPGQ